MRGEREEREREREREEMREREREPVGLSMDKSTTIFGKISFFRAIRPSNSRKFLELKNKHVSPPRS